MPWYGVFNTEYCATKQQIKEDRKKLTLRAHSTPYYAEDGAALISRHVKIGTAVDAQRKWAMPTAIYVLTDDRYWRKVSA